MVRIVHNRVFDFVTEDGFLNILGVFLGFKLGSMYANHNEFVGIGVFQFLKFRQDVHAVDAAVSPEVEKYKFAAQVPQS